MENNENIMTPEEQRYVMRRLGEILEEAKMRQKQHQEWLDETKKSREARERRMLEARQRYL